jgi:predicted short-subunit dehydrogenase-like oxidoreductase (DUF2520 family)
VATDAVSTLSPVAVIGHGRVGRTLAVAFDRLGAEVVVGVRPDAAGDKTTADGLPVALPAEAAGRSNLVLLCVQDDQLPTMVTDLAAYGAFRAGQVVLHTAGVDGPGLLTPAAAEGATVAACHPVQSFTYDHEGNLERLAGTIWGVTGDTAGRRAGRMVAELLGGHAMDIPEQGRARYHAALVLAANGAAALAAVAADLLRSGGVIDPAGLLGRLVHTSVDAALTTGQAGLSGPWVRGDGRTVAMHLEALERRHKVQSVYAALARLVGDRAAASGRLEPETQRRIEATLEERLAKLNVPSRPPEREHRSN